MRPRGLEVEYEPGSRGRVLRNKLGIVRLREMQRAESEALLAAQEWAVTRFSAEHRFTADGASGRLAAARLHPLVWKGQTGVFHGDRGRFWW
jgi:hypothetical protein